MKEKLKPCPFCGEHQLTVSSNEYGGTVVLCGNCDSMGPASERSVESIVEAWNTRATIDPAEAALLAAGEMADCIDALDGCEDGAELDGLYHDLKIALSAFRSATNNTP